MKLRIALLVSAALAAAVPAARADETTFCNAYITTLPYTISTQGHYCFNRNLSTAITTGAAISINVDYVVLDLNNFKLGGGAAGPTTQATGILAFNHSNITIRNGNIRGFEVGIVINGDGVPTANVMIENNVLDGNTYGAIQADSANTTIRNNQILDTGLGGPGSEAVAVGAYGFPTVIEGNFISGIDGYAYAVAAVNYGGVFQNNTIASTASAAGVYYPEICRDNNLLYGAAFLACYSTTGTQP